MSGFHSNFVLFVLISCATSVQVQEKEHLRHRIVLSEIDREAFHGRSHHSVQRRAVSNGTTPAPTQPPVIGHFARLAKDNHQLAIVHWSGANSTAIFILTINRYRNGTSRESNLWRSMDYGQNFTNDNNKVNNTVLDYYYINPHDKTKLIFTGKIAHKLFITEDEGNSYSCVKVPFVPDDIDYSPFLGGSVTAYDKTQKALFVSTNYGQTWTSVGRNITRYYWEVLESEDHTQIYFERLHGSGSKVYVISAPYDLTNVKEFQPDSSRAHFDQNSLVLSHEYILSQVTADGSGTLYVSYKRGQFVAAQFPLRDHLLEQHYLLVDASEGQVFVAVNHRSNLTSLYMSEALGISYTLILEDVVTTSDATWELNSATVQLYNVRGVQGTYFTNQHRHDRTLWTLVSFDKGAQWLTVPAPAVDNLGYGTYCYQPNCSLQLDVRQMVSRDSSIGLIWAQGNVGQSKTRRNQGSFISRDGGLTWRWVFDAYYLASFADHGAVLAAAQHSYWRTTNKVQHSCDEGTTWKSKTMPLSIYVIGVLTEPGERSLIISVFGFESGWTEWLVGQLDFSDIASDLCKPTDYYSWIPTDERIGRRCLLGQSVVYRRRKADVCCYNGYNFDIPISSSVCECAKEDFECDFGYERAELGSPCMPSHGTPTNGPPSICPEGQHYNVTRGYRKVAGDVCHIGKEANLFMYETLPCPIDAPGGLSIKCDHLVVTPGEKLTFILKQVSGGKVATRYTWSFDDGTPDQNFTGYINSQTVVHAFDKSRETPYLVSVVAQNAGGQLSAIKPIVVYDKIVNAKVVQPSLIVENILSTFSVHLDTSKNQSYGSVQYLWYPTKSSVGTRTELPVLSYTYKNAGVYQAKVIISNYLPYVIPFTVRYQVTVASGPGGLLLTASPPRIAAGQRVRFTLNQTVGTTKDSTVYTWTFGDGQTENVTSFSHSHYVDHQYSHSRVKPYEVTVTANTGFADASTATYVVVNDPIMGAIIHKPQKIIENEVGTFSVKLDTQDIYGTIQYYWDMGDGAGQISTSVPLLNYAYQQGGKFYAQVTLNNSLPNYQPYIKKFNVTVESETLVYVTIHVPNTLLAIEHEYSFSVTAKARSKSKSGIVDYKGILECWWQTGGIYDDYLIPGSIVRHSYLQDDVGSRTIEVACENAYGTSEVKNTTTVTVVVPTRKVLLTKVHRLSELYPANATNEVVRNWTVAITNELAKVFEVQSKQLLVILHPSNNSVEVIVLPLSDSHEDVIRAEEVAEQISRRAKGVHLIMTMNNETKDAVIGESEVVALNEMTVNKSGKSTLYIAVGVGVGSLVLVALLVFGVYYYRRKYGRLEVEYHQLRQTGQGNFVYSGGAETIGEEFTEEQEPAVQRLPAKGDLSTVRMSKITDGYD